MSVLTDYPIYFYGFRRKIWVASRVIDVWQSHRQIEPNSPESFGVLIGTTSENKREVWVDNVTTPMAGDTQSRYCFALNDPGHQRTVEAVFVKSNASKIYLGTWHTHPETTPHPSEVDKFDWRICIKENRRRPLIFVIAGTETTRMFLLWGFWFRPLKVHYV